MGRIGGLHLMFLLPYVDVVLGRAPLFGPTPPTWATLMPAHGAFRVLVNRAFAPEFGLIGPLLLSWGWLAVLGAAPLFVFRRASAVRTS